MSLAMDLTIFMRRMAGAEGRKISMTGETNVLACIKSSPATTAS